MADISDDFETFLGQFRGQNEQHMSWMTTFQEQLHRLSEQHRDACRDLERERIAGRHAQDNAEKLDQKLKSLEESVLHSAFVLVLIDADADAYLFDDTYYLDDPADGGKRAAVDLRAAVQHYLQSIDTRLVGLPIIAKAFASGEGLAHLLAKAGIAKPGNSQHILSRFTCGFSQADDMFDFVLVGKGKDRADHKVMGAFRQFAENPCCQHILIGACHDNGYVRMLEKYLHSSAVVRKVTLLKSFQIGIEFTTLPFASTTIKSVFRKQPLGEKPLSIAPNHGNVGRARVAKTTTPPTNETERTREIPVSTTTAAPVEPHRDSPMTYAAQAAVASSVRPLPLFGTLDQGVVIVNADGHRVDCPLPQTSTSATESVVKKTRREGKRYCNKHHLYGHCGGNCSYLHIPLTTAEKLVFRHRLRGEMCHDQGRCRDPKCFYGHHCSCSQTKKCGFPANMHNVDISTWKEVVTTGQH